MQFPTPAGQRGDVLPVVVIGTDAALACLPATPVQLAHACLRAGYRLAVPASWGDELIAADCLRQLADRGQRPAIMCACPHVRDALLETGSDLAPMLVPMVSPPVAVARYLQGLYGRDRVHLTYVGACPAADHADIDERRDPADFLEFLAVSGIRLADQPMVFDSVIPPDRRRFYSVAGGLPSAEQLWGAGNARSLVELDGEDYLIDLAQHLLSHECALIDLAPRLGCACSGASPNVPVRSARAAVAVIEPPRASSTVVDPAIPVELAAPIPLFVEPGHVRTETAEAVDTGDLTVDLNVDLNDMKDATTANSGRAAPQVTASAQLRPEPAQVAWRRRISVTGIRAIQIAVPVARIGSRWLPRAYFAKRRRPLTAAVTPAPAQRPARAPFSAPLGNVADSRGRPRPATRVAAGRRATEGAPSSAVAASVASAPQLMGDPPRS
jgi:hypothetical protein